MTHRAAYRDFVVAVLAVTWLATVAYGQDESLRQAIKVFSRDKAEAERLLRPIVAREPENRLARYFLGEALYCQKKYQGAIGIYEPLVAEELKDPQLAKLLKRPEFPLVLLGNLAMAYGYIGNHEKCFATLEKGIAEAPDYPYFYVNRGRFLAEMGTTWGYDPFLMAGYPTDVCDSSDRLIKVGMLLMRHLSPEASYKILVFLTADTLLSEAHVEGVVQPILIVRADV